MLRLQKSNLRENIGMHVSSGVVACVLMLVVLVLLSLLLLLLLVLLPLPDCFLRCLGGCCRLARLAEESRKWGVMMPLLLVLLAFYPRVGVSHNVFLSVVRLAHYRQAPIYCCTLGIPST